MRKTFQIAAMVMGLAIVALPPPTLAQSELVNGTVTKIDASAGKMTIRHGPIKKFDMGEGMTMVFRVKDPTMLKSVKAGDKIKFDADRVNGQFTVMQIQKVK